MGINTSFISNKNSKEVINESPKLPLATDLADGEIAVNFAKDYETLAIKNESGDVVTFSSDNKFYKKSQTSGATEIQTALGNKQDTLVSGTNIKTINNTSILGSGNITITQIQSDWNESDSSKLSYIENKPFGETTELETYYDSGFTGTQVGQNYGGGQINLIADKYISLSDFDTQYKVTINGESQFVKLVKFANNAFYGLNIESGAESPYTETWSMWTNSPSGSLWVFGKYGAIGEEITLKIEKSNTIINKIDNKYINYSGDTYIQSLVTRIDNKQDTLVSGTNIKTINNTSILGSGNITIEGGNGGFIELVNPSADTKVGLVNKLSQYYDTNIGKGAVIEGDGYEYNDNTFNIVASGSNSHAEGRATQANGDYSHAEGQKTTASGNSSHAEGYSTTASGNSSHAEGYYAQANGDYSHAEGQDTTASGWGSHAEGQNTVASSWSSHAEGSQTTASGGQSHAEGYSTKAIGDYSHAEGQSTTASGNSSHAEGYGTTASSDSSHAEGNYTKAIGGYSHAEGYGTIANGYYSHAEGAGAQAIASFSHAEGQGTKANNNSEHASGQYNVSSSASTTFGDSGNTLFSVGNGTSQARHNAFEIRQNGYIYITSGSTDILLQDYLCSYKLWVGTQSEYDAITNKDSSTIYFIK